MEIMEYEKRKDGVLELIPSECSMMERLMEHFAERVQSLEQCLEYRDMMSTSDGLNMLSHLQSEIDELEKLMQELRKEVEERRKRLKTAETMKQTILDMQERMRTVTERMPACLPAKTQPPPAQEVARLAKPLAKKLNYVESPATNAMDYTNCPTIEELRKNSPALFIPQIEYLTVEEFEAVPKYMKLRLKYEQMNQAIDQLNAVITSKYTVMNNKSRHSERAYKEYKAQETKQTKGCNFVVEKDILSLSHMKLDKNGRNILTILRHCGRMREVRGEGLVRYVFM